MCAPHHLGTNPSARHDVDLAGTRGDAQLACCRGEKTRGYGEVLVWVNTRSLGGFCD
jgi:hypothetical protein